MWRIIIPVAVLIQGICLKTSAQLLTNPVVEKIAEGFQFVEGPVWKEGVGLLFSDIPANKIYLWTEEEGAVVWHEPSGNSNGLVFDENGDLIIAQHGPRQVSRLEDGETIVPLATHYDGKRLNSPNDLAIHSDGSIFFTDPPYGLSGSSEIGFNGIYRLSPSGEVQLLDSTLYRPNGIAFSPDESKLYVTDTESRRVYVWDVVDDTTIASKQELAVLGHTGNGTDGMKVDHEGFLYVSGAIGIWILTSEGIPVDTIPVPGQTTNCAWGGGDRQTLYVTSGNAVYKIYNDTDIPNSTDLKTGNINEINCFPNPFSEFTQISFYANEPGSIAIELYDIKGVQLTSLKNGYIEPGHHIFNWYAGGYSNGIYFLTTRFDKMPLSTILIEKF